MFKGLKLVGSKVSKGDTWSKGDTFSLLKKGYLSQRSSDLIGKIFRQLEQKLSYVNEQELKAIEEEGNQTLYGDIVSF